MDEIRAQLDNLPETWRAAPRRWGHPLHGICSYFAMFPPQIASVFIQWLTQPGEAVYDPFAGRGTVPLEAILQGRKGYGSDANPLAYALTHAKVAIPSHLSLRRRLDQLERECRAAEVDLAAVPAPIQMLYAPGTLAQLVFLRDELGTKPRVDPFIVALVLGMLHANHSSLGATRGFSISMPNTFAMSPGYVRKYIERHELVAPELDVFAMLRKRAGRYDLPTKSLKGGRAWEQDVTERPPPWLIAKKPRLIFTSPPYLEVIKYGKYNWVRLWFLKQDVQAVDAGLMASSSLAKYLTFMSSVLANLRTVLADDGYLCLVIGDVRQGSTQLNLAERVWEDAGQPAGWHRHAIIADELPIGIKVSRIWKNNPGRATKTDRLLLLSPSADVVLPKRPSIDWSSRPRFELATNPQPH